MSVNVYIPTPFRHLVGNRASVKAQGSTVSDILDDLDTQFPGFKAQVVDSSGERARHINIYVNQVEIENLEGESTALKDGDEVAVIPALAGGAPATLTPEMVERYSRHLIMPQVGSSGQRKIIESSVLIIGAGGLGSPVALYLALAGVGKIGIIDFDVVDRSNLQRQILHQTADIGKPKVVSARETLLAHNSNIDVVLHETPITSDNAFEIISQYDIVVNGADNFATRYLVNDAAYLSRSRLSMESILMFEARRPLHPRQRMLPLHIIPHLHPRHGARCAEAAYSVPLRNYRSIRPPRSSARPRNRRAPREPPPPVRCTHARVPRRQSTPRPGLPALRR